MTSLQFIHQAQSQIDFSKRSLGHTRRSLGSELDSRIHAGNVFLIGVEDISMNNVAAWRNLLGESDFLLERHRAGPERALTMAFEPLCRDVRSSRNLC